MQLVDVELNSVSVSLESTGYCTVDLRVSVPWGDSRGDDLQKVMMAAQQCGRLTLSSDNENVVEKLMEEKLKADGVHHAKIKKIIKDSKPPADEPKPEGYGSW